MRLAKNYTATGDTSLYRIGEDGKEYIYFKSKKQKLIIRDFFVSDAENLFKIVANPFVKVTMQEKKRIISNLRDEIAKRDLEDKTISLYVTTVADKPIGAVDFTVKGADTVVKAYLAFGCSPTYSKKIIEAVKEMHQTFWLGDNLYLDTGNGTTALLSKIEISEAV